MTGTVFLNGRFLPSEQAHVSVLDRGWMYGDGLFETLRVANGVPFQWGLHWDRLNRGLEFLQLIARYSNPELLQAARDLSRLNQIPDGVLRIAVSRGVGPRGYSPKGAISPTWVLTLGAFPDGLSLESSVRWRAITSRRIRLEAGPLSSLKTANRLPQILARMEADEAGVEEAIVCDAEGNVVEASGGNVFWMCDGVLHTPPVALGGLPGIARSTVCQLAASVGVPVKQTIASPSQLQEADGLFLSLSTYGVVEVVELDGTALSCHPLTQCLWRAWESLVISETRQRS